MDYPEMDFIGILWQVIAVINLVERSCLHIFSIVLGQPCF